MTIATESVNETEIENESQAGDHQRENENRSVNGNENEKEIVVTKEEILRIVRDIKTIIQWEKQQQQKKKKGNEGFSIETHRERRTARCSIQCLAGSRRV